MSTEASQSFATLSWADRFLPETFADSTPEERRRARILVAIIVLAIGVTSASGVIHTLDGHFARAERTPSNF